MTNRLEAKNVQEAWDMANEIFPSDYNEDSASTQRSGYPIYRSSIEHHDYICDLGNRLEINLKNGKTKNIWIAEETEEKSPKLPTKEEVKEAAAGQYTFEPEPVQFVKVFASGYEYDRAACKAVYIAMHDNEEFWQRRIAEDMVEAYCEDKGIEWGVIRVINIAHYDNGKSNGHYVIEAIVRERVKG